MIVQCDTQNESFVLAADIRTGETVWKTVRKELPSWGTPTVYPAQGGRPAELVTNASNYIRGYDPDSGAERWRLGGSSKITAPTPVFTATSSSSPAAARPSGRSSRSGPAQRETSRWRRAVVQRARAVEQDRPRLVHADAAHLPGHLYVLANQGLLDAYDLASGEEIYRQRVPHEGSGFSASPVAAGGRLYLSSEDGDIFIVRAGRDVRDPGPPAHGRAADGHARDRRQRDVRERREAPVRDWREKTVIRSLNGRGPRSVAPGTRHLADTSTEHGARSTLARSTWHEHAARST